MLELAVLLSHADSLEKADPAYRQELATWVHDGPAEDGIPREALPVDPERGSSLRLRDFELSGPAPSGGEPPVVEHPTVVVILTDDDTPLSWLQAGQALGAVLLRAAQEGVMAQPLAQVTDTLEYRLRLRHALGVLGTPQLALRLGRATAAAPTPRRDVDDVQSQAAPGACAVSLRWGKARHHDSCPRRYLMEYGTTVTTELGFEETVDRTRAALADNGFGILTEIDVQSTLKGKLDQDMEPYLILGACNPQLAHQALEVERDIGLLLPCNVVVRRDGERTVVQALNPQVMVSLPGRPELQPVADEVAKRLNAALQTVAEA